MEWIGIPIGLVSWFFLVYVAMNDVGDNSFIPQNNTPELIDIFAVYIGTILFFLWLLSLWAVWYSVTQQNTEQLTLPFAGLLVFVPIDFAIRMKKKSDQDKYEDLLKSQIQELASKKRKK